MSMIFEVRWDGASWTGETSYLLGYEGVTGFSVEDPTFLDALVAEPGRCRFWVDNFDGHWDGKLTSALADDVVCRLRWGTDLVFHGLIERIVLYGGRVGPQVGVVEAHDWMWQMYEFPVSADYAVSKDVTTALTEIINQKTSWGTSLSDIGDVLGNYGKFWVFPSTSRADAIRDICETWRGRFYAQRSGVYRYLSRQDLQSVATASATIDESDMVGLEWAEHTGSRVREVQVRLIPPDATGSQSVLFTAHTTLKVGAGLTRDITCMFRDAATGKRIQSVSVTTLAATTDYLINGKRDGSGTNYTSSVSVSQSDKADRTVVTVNNTLGVDVFVTFLQVRGVPLYSYDEMDVEASDASTVVTSGARRFRMSLGADAEFAELFANAVVEQWREIRNSIWSVTMRPGPEIAGSVLYKVDVSDVVGLPDQRYLVSELYRVMARRFWKYPSIEVFGEKLNATDHHMRFWFERVEELAPFTLDVAGLGLDQGGLIL